MWPTSRRCLSKVVPSDRAGAAGAAAVPRSRVFPGERYLTFLDKETHRRNERETRIKRKLILPGCGPGEMTITIWNSRTRKSSKGARGMPRLSEAKKDVTSCDKRRGGANGRRSADFRMGEPSARKAHYHEVGRTRGTETSKYPQEEKTTVIPRVAASESGLAQTGAVEAVPGL